MTRLTVSQEALVAEVSNAWRMYKAERAGAEARIRALVAADVAKSVATARQSVTAALLVALGARVPKRALKEVTTKDRLSFNALLPITEAEEDAAELDPAAPAFECWWDGDLIHVRLDSEALPGSEWNPNEPDHWTAVFDYFVRPSDGMVFIDPPLGPAGVRGSAVREWIRVGENMRKIEQWAAATAPS
ncbi:hypothetical protein [Microcella sp.]|uniref:hypothetical protein n=1 Tax=Microcella sp. TaxID=1913979 RepID=UPI00391A3158